MMQQVSVNGSMLSLGSEGEVMAEQLDGSGGGGSVGPNPHEASGEAALLLVESLIHGLVARSGLSLTEAVEIVQNAVDAQVEISDARGDPEAGRARAYYISLLSRPVSGSTRRPRVTGRSSIPRTIPAHPTNGSRYPCSP